MRLSGQDPGQLRCRQVWLVIVTLLVLYNKYNHADFNTEDHSLLCLSVVMDLCSYTYKTHGTLVANCPVFHTGWQLGTSFRWKILPVPFLWPTNTAISQFPEVKFYRLSGAEKCGCHKQIWLALEVLLAQRSWLVEFHGFIVCGMDDVANLTIMFIKQPDFQSCLTPAHHNFRLCICMFTIGAWSSIKLVSGLWCIWKFNRFNTSCCCNDETFKRHICLPVSMYIWINIS